MILRQKVSLKIKVLLIGILVYCYWCPYIRSEVAHLYYRSLQLGHSNFITWFTNFSGAEKSPQAGEKNLKIPLPKPVRYKKLSPGNI